MKNIVKAALLTSAIGLGSCNHNSQESNSDVPVQQTYTSKQIGFQNNAVNAIHSSSEIETNVLKIYGKSYNFPVVNKTTASKIHYALMHMTLGQSPQEVQQTICAQKDVKKILDGTPVVSKDETYRYMQSILRQSGLFFEPMVYDKTKSLVAIDSVVKKPIDIVLFKQIFWDDFSMKDINVAYIHEMSMREGTLADNTVILNTATVAESIHVDGRFTTKSSPETYTQSVINNEIVHAYLRQKYGKLTDGAFPVWHLLVDGENYEATALDIAEFISDVAAINTDVTYFSTPLSQYLTDEQSGKKAFEHYKLSKTMAATMITEIYIKYPNLADKLWRIMDDGKLRYQAAVETGDQHQVLMSLGNTQLEYLKVFYSMMSPEIEWFIQGQMTAYAKAFIEELDIVKYEIDGLKTKKKNSLK